MKRTARATPGHCYDCVLPVVPGQKRCEYHRDVNRGMAKKRYQRDQQRMRETIAANADRPPPTAPEGTNPQRAPSYRVLPMVEQHPNCARRTECLNFAVRQNWQGFTCSSCTVREVAAKGELETRVGYLDGMTFPVAP